MPERTEHTELLKVINGLRGRNEELESSERFYKERAKGYEK